MVDTVNGPKRWMRSLLWTGLVLAAPMLARGEPGAQELLAACPLRIETTQKASTLPAGFEQHRRGVESRLYSAGVYQRHPRERVSLSMVPEGSEKNPRTGNAVFVWDFPASKDELWIECRYFASDIVLWRSIGSGPVSCRMEPDARSHLAPLVSPLLAFECRRKAVR